MTATHDPKEGTVLSLPPIALSDIKETTKDFLLSKANAGMAPTDVIKDLLDKGAARAGFKPSPATPTEEAGQ